MPIGDADNRSSVPALKATSPFWIPFIPKCLGVRQTRKTLEQAHSASS